MKSEIPKEIVALYLPVIHAGYIDLLERHQQADVGVLGDDILREFPYLRKEIRALHPEQAASLLRGLGRSAFVLSSSDLSTVNEDYETVIMPNDDISQSIASHFNTVEFEPVFLRWDRENAQVNQEITPDRRILATDPEAEPMIAALVEASKNSTWWRRVGAAIVKDSDVILQSHNRTLPTDYTNWIEGDPRNTTRRGEGAELYNEIHAEAGLIAEAAEAGISLKNLSIYVTTFPCPNCAKLITKSGISHCYYSEGYALLNGHEIMRNEGIELIKVDGIDRTEDALGLRPYPKTNLS